MSSCAAASSSPSPNTGVNGTCPNWVGSMPHSRCSIVVLPASAISYTQRRSTFASPHRMSIISPMALVITWFSSARLSAVAEEY